MAKVNQKLMFLFTRICFVDNNKEKVPHLRIIYCLTLLLLECLALLGGLVLVPKHVSSLVI